MLFLSTIINCASNLPGTSYFISCSLVAKFPQVVYFKIALQFWNSLNAANEVWIVQCKSMEADSQWCLVASIRCDKINCFDCWHFSADCLVLHIAGLWSVSISPKNQNPLNIKYLTVHNYLGNQHSSLSCSGKINSTVVTLKPTMSAKVAAIKWMLLLGINQRIRNMHWELKYKAQLRFHLLKSTSLEIQTPEHTFSVHQCF